MIIGIKCPNKFVLVRLALNDLALGSIGYRTHKFRYESKTSYRQKKRFIFFRSSTT